MSALETIRTAATVPVGPYVREQLLARLQTALEIARRDLETRFEEFRDVLGEVVERADAISLGAVAGESDAPTGLDELLQPSSRLRVTALARDAGEPVRAFLLIPFGAVQVDRPVAGEGFEFSRRHAESAKRWFDQIGRKLAIDYEHQSFDRLNTRSDGLRPAAGWIGGLEVRDDGLWAVDVTWTEKAAELLRSGEYRYFSPVIYWTDEDRADVAALGPVALTNDPAMRGVAALAARRALDSDAAPQRDDDACERAEATRATVATVAALRAEIAARDADAFVQRGLASGRIVPTTREDWREDFLRDPAAAEQRLARAPVVLPPGRATTLRTSAASDATVRTTGPGIEPEDLAAYERALTAGRVARPVRTT